jgi:hypothetical protein
MSNDKPLISPESAGYLAQIINRVAASFDVAALSNEEAIEIYMLLDRLTETLWREHKRTLFLLYQAMLQRLGLPVDDEPDDDEPEGSGGDPH